MGCSRLNFTSYFDKVLEEYKFRSIHFLTNLHKNEMAESYCSITHFVANSVA
jgi:hypothetical protein